MEMIKIDITILKPITKVWDYFTDPEHITQWHFANENWSCPKAVNNVADGGHFNFRMEMEGKSFGFDFAGTYDKVVPLEMLKYHFEDGRNVEVLFEKVDEKTTKVTETFEPDPAEPREMQRDGWYAILNNFHKHVEQD